MDQPTTFRLQTSMTTARKRKPAQVGMYVMSATQSLLGPSASNFRSTRSGDAGLPSRVVVTQKRRRETPAMPALRIKRVTCRIPTRMPSTSANSARIRGAT
jgi:hypothetical protein